MKYTPLRNSPILRLVLASSVLLASSCAIVPTVTLAPGAERVRLTKNASDVAECKPVGYVSVVPDMNRQYVEYQQRNRTIALDGNTLLFTMSGDYEGVAYRCP
jgi:hypothetical protein